MTLLPSATSELLRDENAAFIRHYLDRRAKGE